MEAVRCWRKDRVEGVAGSREEEKHKGTALHQTCCRDNRDSAYEEGRSARTSSAEMAARHRWQLHDEPHTERRKSIQTHSNRFCKIADSHALRTMLRKLLYYSDPKVKLNKLPTVKPPTRHSPMNPPTASLSSSFTQSPAPIMQLLPRYPLLSPNKNCTTIR